jgi:hypothetical protein
MNTTNRISRYLPPDLNTLDSRRLLVYYRNFDLEPFESSVVKRRPTEEDLRIHAWLTRRLAVVNYEQHGLWPRLRRLLFGNRLMQWLIRGS